LGLLVKVIPTNELKWETHPPNPIGGQHVGCGSMGVRLTHLPTEIVIEVNVGRSLHRNRQIALDALLGALTSPHYLKRIEP
jgi:protein subunit release factor A